MILFRFALTLLLIGVVFIAPLWGGTWTSNGFLYKPDVGARGATEKSTFDSGLDRMDARLGKEIWLGDPNYGATLQAAITAIGSTSCILQIPSGTHSISANLTIPANIALKVERGADLAINNATLTINGGLEAGPYQIFSLSGTGKVVFNPGAVKEVYPEWWGAKGDSTTNDTAAFQAAMAALNTTVSGKTYSGTVKLLNKRYAVNILVNQSGIRFAGVTAGHPGGDSGPALIPYDTDSPVMQICDDTARHFGIWVENIRFDAHTVGGKYGIKFGGGAEDVYFNNIVVDYFKVYGIHFDFGSNYPIEYIFFNNFYLMGYDGPGDTQRVIYHSPAPPGSSTWTTCMFFSNGVIMGPDYGHTIELDSGALNITNVWMQTKSRHGIKFSNSTGGSSYPAIYAASSGIESSIQSESFLPAAVDPDADNITLTGTWTNGTPIQFSNSGGSLPGGLVAATEYYVVNSGGGTIQVAATRGGTPIDLTSQGTGSHTICDYQYGIVFDIWSDSFKNLDSVVKGQLATTGKALWPGYVSEDLVGYGTIPYKTGLCYPWVWGELLLQSPGYYWGFPESGIRVGLKNEYGQGYFWSEASDIHIQAPAESIRLESSTTTNRGVYLGSDNWSPLLVKAPKLTTTNATPTVLQPYIQAQNDSTMQIEATVVAYCTSGADAGKGVSWKLEATIRKVGGADPAIVGSVTTVHSGCEISGAAATIAVAAGSGYARINVTGVAGDTIDWSGFYRVVKVN